MSTTKQLWANRIVAHGDEAPEKLIAHGSNWRTHTATQRQALSSVLAEVGLVQSVVVNRTTGRLVDGHLRVELAKAQGQPTIPVAYVELSDDEEAIILASLDPIGAMASADREKLQELLTSIQSEDEAVRDLLERIAAQQNVILAPAGGLIDEDAVPVLPDASVTRPQDLWILGSHKLLCADSGSASDLDHLLEGATIHLVNMDPPYNVDVQPRSNNALAAGLSSFGESNSEPQVFMQQFDAARRGHRKPTNMQLRPKDRPLANDFLSDEQFATKLRAWFGNAARVLEPGRSFFIWGGYANWRNYCAALEQAGLYFSQGITWVKHHAVLGRKDMMNDSEYCWYGWKEGAAHQWLGPNNVSNVWEVTKVSAQSMVHLTEKPVGLAARALQCASRPGEHVLDLFGGSGSTLIAAEQTGRCAYLLEIDPLYCDVIVTRWQQFVGGKAVFAADGRSYDEVAAERRGQPEGR